MRPSSVPSGARSAAHGRPAAGRAPRFVAAFPDQPAALRAVGSAAAMKAFSDSVIPYPQAVRGTDGQRFHEFTVADPYRWLGEARPETTAWIEAQKAVTTEFLEQLEARSIVRARLRAFQDDGWPAYAGSRGDWEFLFERASDGGRILVRRRANGERATFDPGGVEALEGLRASPGLLRREPGWPILGGGSHPPGDRLDDAPPLGLRRRAESSARRSGNRPSGDCLAGR